MSWKKILKNDKKYPDNRDKFPRYIRVEGTDYKISSYSGMGTTASYNSIEMLNRKIFYSDGHLENLTLEYALKHNIDSEYEKEIQEESEIDYDQDYYQLDEDEEF